MVDIKYRLMVLFPGITFGASLLEGDCVITDGKITEWGRVEPKPTTPELKAVPQANIDIAIEEVEAAEQAILTKQEIADLKHASPKLLELLKHSDQKITADVLLETSGASNNEIVAGIREAQAKTRIMLRDLANAVKAMVS